MVDSGIARWYIDSRNRVSSTMIEMVEDDPRVNSGMNGRSTNFSLWPFAKFIGNHVEDAFPGRPVLWTIGYDRRSAGGHQAA